MGGPPSLEQAIHSLPVPGAVHRKERPSSCTCCARARRSLRTVAPPLGHAFTVGAVNLRAATDAEHAAGRILAQALAGIRQEPDRRRSASKTSRRRSKLGNPLLAGHRARAGQLQLLHARLPQPREPGVRERRRRHARARRLRARADRAQQRGLPVLGARQRAVDRTRRPAARRSSTTTTCTSNPYPNVAGPGQPQAVRSGQRDLHAGQGRDRQPAAASVGTNREITTPRTEPVRRKVPELRRSRPSASSKPRRRGRRNEPRAGGAATTRCPVVELQRSNPVRFGVIVVIVLAIVVVLRLHQAHPVQTRLPPEGRVRHAPSTSTPSRPCASPASTSARSASIQREGNTGVVTMEIESSGLPIHADATAEDPPAHLPRRQLVRRTAARQPVGADASPRATRSRSRRPPTRSSSTRCSTRSTPTRARTCRTS